MEYGEDLEFYKSIQQDGIRTPLDSIPDEDITTEWFLSTFGRLSASRTSSGVGLNPISLTEILKYFEIFETPFELSFTIDVIQKIDAKYLKIASKKQERSSA